MEKFGIFELLDTLSALLSDGPSSGEPAAPSSPSPTDTAFSPPAYGEETPPPQEGKSALASLLERHEKAVRRITGKKP